MTTLNYQILALAHLTTAQRFHIEDTSIMELKPVLPIKIRTIKPTIVKKLNDSIYDCGENTVGGLAGTIKAKMEACQVTHAEVLTEDNSSLS